jgi:hypothetical protein
MPYQVDKFNGTFLTNVPDGTIDNTTDLRFVGKNYAGYGEVQNENFLHLLENFANTTPPPKRITGQIWYDSGKKRLRYFDGTIFKAAGGAEISDTPPPGLQTGELWFNTSTNQLNCWTGSAFVLVGPQTAPGFGTSTFTASIVKAVGGTNYAIVKLSVADEVIAILSKEAFTIDSTINPIPGFSVVKKGFTLPEANSTTGVTALNWKFWGTAADADRLGGFPAADYIKSSQASFTNPVTFTNDGYEVGFPGGKPLRVYIEGGEFPIIQNQNGLTQDPGTLTLRIKTNTTDRDPIVITKDGFYPILPAGAVTPVFDIGRSDSKYRNIYSVKVFSNLQGDLIDQSATRTIVDSTNRRFYGSIWADDNTIAYNSQTRTFNGFFTGSVGAQGTPVEVVGSLTGSCTGSSGSLIVDAGSARFATTTVPAGVASIAARDTDGDLTARIFKGVAEKSDTLKVGASSYFSASIATPGGGDKTSIVSRDNNGDIYVNIMNGTATAARYADLAEKYLTDKEYAPGTVVSVCEHEEHEVEACQWGQRAIGVVSTNPAFMMNKDLEGGTYIALKGRVPCKVIGAVRKGQRLIAGNNGTAVAAVPHSGDVFAIALESSNDIDVKVIEVLVL